MQYFYSIPGETFEKYEIKKKDERELYRQRKKLGLVKSRNVGDEQRQENQQ